MRAACTGTRADDNLASHATVGCIISEHRLRIFRAADSERVNVDDEAAAAAAEDGDNDDKDDDDDDKDDAENEEEDDAVDDSDDDSTIDDWSDHLTTLFPEVRLKRFLEMRGADGGRWGTITALPAFWTGILYDETALGYAWQMVRDWTDAEREGLRDAVPRTAFATPFRGTTVRDLARQALRISRLGLKNRRRINALNQDETVYLAPLERIAGNGRTISDELLRRYSGAWRGNIDHIFEEFAF